MQIPADEHHDISNGGIENVIVFVVAVAVFVAAIVFLFFQYWNSLPPGSFAFLESLVEWASRRSLPEEEGSRHSNSQGSHPSKLALQHSPSRENTVESSIIEPRGSFTSFTMSSFSFARSTPKSTFTSRQVVPVKQRDDKTAPYSLGFNRNIGDYTQVIDFTKHFESLESAPQEMKRQLQNTAQQTIHSFRIPASNLTPINESKSVSAEGSVILSKRTVSDSSRRQSHQQQTVHNNNPVVLNQSSALLELPIEPVFMNNSNHNNFSQQPVPSSINNHNFTHNNSNNLNSDLCVSKNALGSEISPNGFHGTSSINANNRSAFEHQSSIDIDEEETYSPTFLDIELPDESFYVNRRNQSNSVPLHDLCSEDPAESEGFAIEENEEKASITADDDSIILDEPADPPTERT
jgi:hypothetical protein